MIFNTEKFNPALKWTSTTNTKLNNILPKILKFKDKAFIKYNAFIYTICTVIFIILAIIIINMKNSVSILIVISLLVALYIYKVQPKMKIASNVIISNKQGAFIEFLSRNNSKGFIKCCNVDLLRKIDSYNDKVVIPDELISKYLSDDIKLGKAVTDKRVTKFILSNNDTNNIQDLFNSTKKIEFKNDEYEMYLNKVNNNDSVSNYYFRFYFTTNDNYIRKTVTISIQDLIKKGLISNQ
ncbi:hypothetical protein MOO46_01985 [Apilactobacillus apisilvae]|uniref:Uncharacterized protein n=1 Tax=Apilactobacillus apisilvae TaxID=2923364 RepID=A0ABY4PIV5_9LACO|nr:hypothetical protein [Apilactobacillus apisilvae]UQS85381.1 hypothetical protein MOO46_01985 [Apilactobacillus apisilvae]